MKYLLLLIIRIYWAVIPASKRRRCIFRESCSRYVYRITVTEGFVAGFKAFKFRNRHCQPNYAIYKFDNKYELKTAHGLILSQDEIAEHLISADNPEVIDLDSINSINLMLKDSDKPYLKA